MSKSGFRSPPAVRVYFLSVLAWAVVTLPLAGRVGERQAQIEDRMLADGTAVRMQNSDVAAVAAALRAASAGTAGTGGTGRRGGRGGGGPQRGGADYSGGFDIANIDTLLWQSIGQNLPEPDSNGVRRRPPEFPEYIYFKTDDGSDAAKKIKNPPDNLSGWELHVYLYKQLSGLEVYHRVGAPLTDAEISAILSANRANASWTRNGQNTTVELPGDDTGGASFIGFEFERTDGLVRAAKVGNDLIIFSTELDKALMKVRDALSRAAAEGKGPTSGGSSSVGNSTRGF